MRRVVALGVIVLGLALPGVTRAQSRASTAAALDHREVDRALRGARYAVIVGDMRDATKSAGGDLARRLAEGVARRLRELRRVVVLHAREASVDVLDRIGRRRLPTLRLEGSVMSVERGELAGQPSVRCQVALILRDEHGGALRSVLRGAATFAEWYRGPRREREQRLVRNALDRALDSALHGASRALADAVEHAALAPRHDSRLALRR